MASNQNSGSSAFVGFIIFAAILAVFGAIMFGTAWISVRVLPWLNIISAFLFPIVVVILIPLGFLRATRSFAGNALYISSFVFGLTLWVTGFVTTFQHWGLGALVIGLFLGGVGVVPIGLLASLFSADWLSLGSITMLLVLTFGCRILGVMRVAKAAEEQEAALSLRASATLGG